MSLIDDLIRDPQDLTLMKVLLYGPAGYGKTTLLATAMEDPRLSPILVLDYEGGTSVLGGTKVKVFDVKGWDDFNQIYAILASGDHPFKTIAIDSMTEAHMASLLGRLDVNTRNRKDPDALDMNDYGIALTQTRRLLRTFRDLPYHFIATALSQDVVDPREGSIKKPNLQGRLADEAQGIFDIVAYLSRDVDEEGTAFTILALQNYPKIKTKIRIPMHIKRNEPVPDEIFNPTLGMLLDIFLGIDAAPVEETIVHTNGSGPDEPVTAPRKRSNRSIAAKEPEPVVEEEDEDDDEDE